MFSGPARNAFRVNIWPLAGSIARTEALLPPRPASAFTGRPVLPWRPVENMKPLPRSMVPAAVKRCRMSFGVGPQSSSQSLFVMSAGSVLKSLARLKPFDQV